MAEIDSEKFYEKLDEIKTEFQQGLSSVNIRVAEFVAALKSIKTHEAPCRFLEDHKKDQTKRSQDIYKKIDEHVKDHHSLNYDHNPDKAVYDHIKEYHSSNAPSSAEKLLADHIQKEHSAESDRNKKMVLYTALCALGALASFFAGMWFK